MKTQKERWSRTELEIYILLLCANVDSKETPEELRLISTKVDEQSFDRIYNEFTRDTEEQRLEKIQDAIAVNDFSHKELENFKKEMHRIFFSDKQFSMMERNLDKILDNIIY
ncbi:hypothetical protein [Gramella sp. KN1008]|uniref:hypothetical protein n=1 Tax=Gramella sp. KN1008 TaxID=2529298 RepID=UPI00103F8600|nr:hypothetical protein [Gramella sp. KN1008]TBW30228.1 hypothetical protein EZJ28_02150 [Gramella sp. KN1008]